MFAKELLFSLTQSLKLYFYFKNDSTLNAKMLNKSLKHF